MIATTATWWIFPTIGVFTFLFGSFLFSNNKKAIDWGLIVRCLCFQVLIAVLLLELPQGRVFFQQLGQGVEQIQGFANQGAAFVFGGIASKPEVLASIFGADGSFIFALKLIPSLIFIGCLIHIAYYFNILQKIVKIVAWAMNLVLGVSGAETLSNSASVFLGQIEAQMLVRPYLATMTQSELLAIMAGSMACISGGMMAIYIGMGIPSSYLLTASLMAVPAAFAIAKILIPETHLPDTQGSLKLVSEQRAVNFVDAASQGANEGWHIGVSVITMLIAFIALVAFLDAGLGLFGKQLITWGVNAHLWGMDLTQLSMGQMLGAGFYWVALLLGVPAEEAQFAGSLMGTKLVLNEFVAYSQLLTGVKAGLITPQSQAILSFALCGFANLSSVAMQLGGIGAMVPERRAEIAKLGIKAMLAGNLASYLSATMAGMLLHVEHAPETPIWGMWGIGVLAVVIILFSRWFFPKPAYQLQADLFKPLVTKPPSPQVFKPLPEGAVVLPTVVGTP
jgi:CNT family concentrative nucleoside transporter